jgi:hypothetical protein
VVTKWIHDAWTQLVVTRFAALGPVCKGPHVARHFVGGVGLYREVADFAALVAKSDGQPLAAIREGEVPRLSEVARLPLIAASGKLSAARDFVLTANQFRGHGVCARRGRAARVPS